MAEDKQIQRLRRELRRVHRADLVASTVLVARELLRLRPKNSWDWFRLGDSLREIAHHAEAEVALRNALRDAPSDLRPWILGRLATLFRDRGDDKAARRWFRRAMAAAPQEATWPILLGGLLASRGQFAAAATCHRRATRCRTGCIDEAWLNLGLVRRAQGRLRDAERCFLRALELDPRYRDARLALRDVRYARARSTR